MSDFGRTEAGAIVLRVRGSVRGLAGMRGVQPEFELLFRDCVQDSGDSAKINWLTQIVARIELAHTQKIFCSKIRNSCASALPIADDVCKNDFSGERNATQLKTKRETKMIQLNTQVAKHDQTNGRKAKLRGEKPTRTVRYGVVIEIGTGVDAGRVRIQWDGGNRTWMAEKVLEIVEVPATVAPVAKPIKKMSEAAEAAIRAQELRNIATNRRNK